MFEFFSKIFRKISKNLENVLKCRKSIKIFRFFRKSIKIMNKNKKGGLAGFASGAWQLSEGLSTESGVAGHDLNSGKLWKNTP